MYVILYPFIRNSKLSLKIECNSPDDERMVYFQCICPYKILILYDVNFMFIFLLSVLLRTRHCLLYTNRPSRFCPCN